MIVQGRVSGDRVRWRSGGDRLFEYARDNEEQDEARGAAMMYKGQRRERVLHFALGMH